MAVFMTFAGSLVHVFKKKEKKRWAKIIDEDLIDEVLEKKMKPTGVNEVIYANGTNGLCPLFLLL